MKTILTTENIPLLLAAALVILCIATVVLPVLTSIIMGIVVVLFIAAIVAPIVTNKFSR